MKGKNSFLNALNNNLTLYVCFCFLKALLLLEKCQSSFLASGEVFPFCVGSKSRTGLSVKMRFPINYSLKDIGNE
mgnify:CR=1 FL=1